MHSGFFEHLLGKLLPVAAENDVVRAVRVCRNSKVVDRTERHYSCFNLYFLSISLPVNHKPPGDYGEQ